MRRQSARRAFSMIELLVVLVIVAVLLALAVPSLRSALDRAAVRAAVSELVTALAMARENAIRLRAPIAVEIDTMRGSLTVRLDTTPLLRRDLGQTHAVRLSATRDSTAYDAHGLGIGAANLSVVVCRGSAAESVVVSRLGRVRRQRW